MMKRSIVFLLALGLPACLLGQSNDSIVQTAEEKTTTVQDELWNRIETLTLQLAAKEKTIIRLREDSVDLHSAVARQNERIAELESEVARANATAEMSQKGFETIRQAVLSNDAVLYKQCLLYPLERRYNPSLILDALSTVEVFASLGQMSEKFVEYRNTYEPLLKQYEIYNQQLLGFLGGCVDYIEKREEKLGAGRQIPIPKDSWLDELKKLPYYQECYVNKDTPPFKSIIYLDDIMDDFKSVIEQKGDMKAELQKLVKKLEPKKN